MTVRSRLRPPAVRAVAGSTVAICALMGAMGSSVAQAAEAASTTAAAAAHAASTVTRYTVKSGQSLNDIAIAATRSHDRAVVARAAKAIFEANPSSFIRGDASRMKLGAVLNVPPLDASESASAVPTSSGSVAHAGGGAGAGAAASAVRPASSGTAAAAAPASSAAQGVAPAALAAEASSVAPASASTAAAVAASGAGQPTLHQQTSGAAASAAQAPAVISRDHAWAGTIQSAASEPAQSAASEVVTAGPASAVNVSVASAGALAPVSGASAAGAPHARFSSLQQLLALKNRVLMDLQRHGFGSQAPHEAAGNQSSAASDAAAAARQAPGPAPRAAGLPPTPVHAPTERLSTVGERFIGFNGHGITVSGSSIRMAAAIASAIVAALLVLVVGFTVSGRKRRAARAAAASRGADGEARAETSGATPPPVVDASSQDPIEAEFLAMLAHTPTSKRALMGLAARYAEHGNVRGFNEIAQRIRDLSGQQGPNWLHVASLGRQLDPDNPLYALSGNGAEDVATPSDERDVGAVPDHSATAQQQAEAAQSVSEGAKAKEEPSALPASEEPNPAAPAVDEAPPASAAALAPDAQHEQPEARGESGELPVASQAEAAPSQAPFPADAVDALNELDMALPPRAEGPARADASGLHAARAHGPDAPHADDTAREPAAASVAGLGAARFGALNLAFDLDLPGAETGTPTMVALPAQPVFSPEEIAKIARNKLELAAEYIALGDVGGARTLIHEVIESNDPGTRDEAHALLATLAPLS